MKQFLFVAIGGALGAVGRYSINEYVQRRVSTDFPLGTLTVNVIGCLLIGIILQLAAQSDWVSPASRALIVTGFLGALTTFSTFGYDTLECAKRNVLLAALNISANVMLGLIAVVFGIMMAKFLGKFV